ncbi:MAG: FAD-containing oxidoreductase, partial [Dolichospermum sp.]
MSISESSRVTIRPMDEYNQKLLKKVNTDNWFKPQPADINDVLLIGGGTPGVVVAAGAAGLD